jgi:RpiR family transcriptional regulator, carbohydrate utilization regulator
MISSDDNLLDGIRHKLEALSPAERKVADVVMARPEDAIYMSLADLARESTVSEPTVVRFSRAIGCDGFTSFKIRLAQSMAQGFSYADLGLLPSDTVDVYATKVFRATIDTLVKVHQQLDAGALQDAVDAIAKARRLEFFGLGASGVVALDAYHKFFRLIDACAAFSDTHMQHMSASALTPDDVVVAISHTGRTKELLEAVDAALASGATVVAITAPDSPLAEQSTIVLGVDVQEDTDVHTPMISRLAHLVIIDTLAVGVAHSGNREASGRLQRMKESLHVKRTPRRRER